MPTFLGIDVSTTAARSLLIDEQGAVLAVAATCLATEPGFLK